MRLIRPLGFLLSTIGIIVISYVSIDTFRIINLLSKGETTKGLIISEKLIQFDGKKYYIYSVEYEVDGFEYSIQTKNNSSKKKYAIGELLSIYYDSNNPSHAIINNRSEIYNALFIGYSISLLISGVGFLFIIKTRFVVNFFNSFKSLE